jgi:hypothetical protein
MFWFPDLPLDDLVQKLARDEPFALARYGDTACYSLQGVPGHDADGADYTPEVAAGVIASFHNPSLLHCVNSSVLQVKPAPRELLKTFGVSFLDGDTLDKAVIAGALWSLTVQMRRKRLLYIGPDWLEDFIVRTFGATFLTVSSRHAFYHRNAIEAAAQVEIEEHDVNMVALSCGVVAAILVDRLNRRYPDVTIWDMGSTWDVFAGHPTRSGPKRWTAEYIAQLAKANFGVGDPL